MKTNLILFIFDILHAQQNGILLVFYIYCGFNKLIKLLIILFKFDENFVKRAELQLENCFLSSEQFSDANHRAVQ